MSTNPLPPTARESALCRFLRSRVNLAASLALATLGAYLLATHTGHVLEAVPYLVLLACPLLHVFMHRGHGHGK